MPRSAHSFKISDALWDAFRFLRAVGRIFGKHKSDSAAMENLVFYSLYFRREHILVLSELTYHEQDLIHDYTKWCVLNDIDDRERLPKPATAQDVLKLAREWDRRGRK